MKFNNSSTLLRAVFTALLMTNLYAANSLVDALVQKEDYKTLSNYISKALVINHESELPNEAKNNDLVIIDNEYDVKIMYEYLDGEWLEKGGERIAQILNGGEKTTYHHLFNFKLDSEEFNSNTKDDGLVQVEILKSPYKQANLNSTIQEFINKRGINHVINIQLQNCTQKYCDVVIFYKY